MKQEFITGKELNEKLMKPEDEVVFIPAKPEIKWSFDDFSRAFLSGAHNKSRQELLDGNWVYDTPRRKKGNTWVMAELIYHEVRPPYRYEFIPGKQTVIIGRDDKKYLFLSNSEQFPQHLVSILNKVVEMKNKY